MKHRIKNISIVVFLLIAAAAEAQQRYTLDSVITRVKAHNPMLKSYRVRADAMNAYAAGARSLMAPEAGGGLWMLPYRTVEDPRDKGQIMVSVSQKFTHPAKLRANQNYLNSKAAIEQASEAYVFNELRAQAKTLYYQWMVLEKKKSVLSDNETAVSLMLKLAQLRYPYNQGKLGAIYKAEGKLQEIRNMMLMNDNEIVQKNLQLNQLMNLPGATRYSIDTGYRATQLMYDETDTAALAERRSDIRRIDKSIQSMRLNQALENSQAKPDFNISFNHMFARGAGMPNQFMLLGMVSIPIAPWSSKMYKANLHGMEKEIESMKSERVSILNELQVMTAGMSNEIVTLRKQIENYEKRIIPSLQKNYESLMRDYEENREELPNVIDGWETLSMTRLQYLDTVQKYYETIVNYEKQIENE
ncbi:MAG: TolC family protein [Bacteroidetes bacterium]|nr:TolC family protein [Bacteroidota bacterium]